MHAGQHVNPTTIPVGIRFPGMVDGTQPAGRTRDGNDAI